MAEPVEWLRAVVVNVVDPPRLADPEGNEFTVVLPLPPERGAQGVRSEGHARVTERVDAIGHDGTTRSRIISRVLMLMVTAVALYLVLPGLIAMFGSLPQLEAVFPAWFVPIFVLEAAAFVCIWVLVRDCTPTTVRRVRAAHRHTLSRALPGGAATGGATMYQMLTRAGFDRRDHQHHAHRGRDPVDRDAVRPAGARAARHAAQPRGAVRAAAGRAPRWRARRLPAHRRVRSCSSPTASSVASAPPSTGSCTTCCGAGPRPDAGAEAGQIARLRAHRAGRVVEAGGAGRVGQPAVRLPRALRQPPCGRLPGRPGVGALAFVAGSTLAMIPITPGGLGFVEAGLTGVLALRGGHAPARGVGNAALPVVLLLAPAAVGPRRVGALPAPPRLAFATT